MFGAERRVRCGFVVVAAALIHIFAFPSYAQGAKWTISVTPTVRLGASESPDESLMAPVGATRLPSGNIVVGDLGDWALREFSPTGKLVKHFARKGKGPGEVSYLFGLHRCGDSLVAIDLQDPRASIYKIDGTFVRQFRFKRPTLRRACNASMRFVVMEQELRTVVIKSINRPTLPFRIAPADSGVGMSLGELPGMENYSNGPLALGRDPRVAIGRTAAYVALSDSFDIRVYDLNGKQRTSFTQAIPRVRATASDLEAEKERQIASMGEGMRAGINRMFTDMPLTEFLPATRDIVVDADDNLWVQHYPQAKQVVVRWTIFSNSGQVRGTLEHPAAFDIYEIGRDYILGRYRDSREGIPEVRMYSLKRSR